MGSPSTNQPVLAQLLMSELPKLQGNKLWSFLSPWQQGARSLELLLLLCDTGAIVPSSLTELDANFTDQPPISLFNSYFHVVLKQCTGFRKVCVSTHTFRQYDNNWDSIFKYCKEYIKLFITGTLKQ